MVKKLITISLLLTLTGCCCNKKKFREMNTVDSKCKHIDDGEKIADVKTNY